MCDDPHLDEPHLSKIHVDLFRAISVPPLIPTLIEPLKTFHLVLTLIYRLVMIL